MVAGMSISTDYSEFTNTDYWEKYVLNTFQFSAAKSLAEMAMLQKMVFDENGKKRSFAEFQSVAPTVTAKFEQWMRVEYDLAGRGAVMAEKWKDIWQSREAFPYFQYETRGDSRVRKHHEKLDGKVFRIDDAKAQGYWPPLDWNCRCTAEATDEGTPLTSEELDKYKSNIGEGFEGNVGIDGIMPITHTYKELLKNANKAKPNMF
jgi:SPP1 gp7 family putative phage head morphogenesis protein